VYWNEPDSHGNDLESYQIMIRQADGEYSETTSECDGTDASILQHHQCYIRMQVLRDAPYSLDLNTVVEIYVVATNAKGTSDPSEVNTEGGIVQNVPQVQLTLERGELTDATKVQLVWNLLPEGNDQGFAALTQYRILWEVAQVFVQRTVISDPQ